MPLKLAITDISRVGVAETFESEIFHVFVDDVKITTCGRSVNHGSGWFTTYDIGVMDSVFGSKNGINVYAGIANIYGKRATAEEIIQEIKDLVTPYLNQKSLKKQRHLSDIEQMKCRINTLEYEIDVRQKDVKRLKQNIKRVETMLKICK